MSTFENGEEVLGDSWVAGSETCVWRGVTCTDGHVTSIDLSGEGLLGSIPPGGWDLPPSLETLSLSSNSIAGSLTEDWASSLPGGLEQLSLDDTVVSGLPAHWSLPEKLGYLSIQNTPIHSTLPANWTFGPELRWVSLANANITGTIPQQWSLPPAAANIILQGNELEGEC
jgi:hypothetical protein